MQGILYEESSILTFAIITFVMGGWTAWRTGRAMAESWSGIRTLVAYVLLLGVALRFIHHALFDGTFLSPHYYLVDTIVLMGFAYAGYRFTRTGQMTTQYYWLYRKTSPFSWAPK
ncbi:MAG: hypothetical protein LBE86_11430 [Gemmobacter sp.]|jgi:predicted permease|nr:hypothetical protein [Gemmobacter sp.]